MAVFFCISVNRLLSESDPVNDEAFVTFLQASLPRLNYRWQGFRRVRRQVLKRVQRRIATLGLADLAAYREYLELNAAEWSVLDGFCRISVTRFFRDRRVYEALESPVLTDLARRSKVLRCWSAGCAGGEEPYSLRILWDLGLQARFPDTTFTIVATDADANALARAHAGVYRSGSLKEVPGAWRDHVFATVDNGFALVPAIKQGVTFLQQDLRSENPAGPFDLVLCRNLAFSYFDRELQSATARRLVSLLQPGGYLVAGTGESLPDGVGLTEAMPAVYRRNQEDPT